MAQNYSKRPALKYDAHGRLVQNKPKSRIPAFLFGFLVPYLLINGILLFLVIATPTVETEDADTKDYRTATMKIHVSSLLPIKDLTATLGGEDVSLEKSGNDYIATVDTNGSLTVTARSINGMEATAHGQVNLLDETPPTVDEDSVDLGSGYLEFKCADSQSGIDYDGIYGIDGDGDRVKPTDINRSTGQITFSMKTDTLQVIIPDLAGNETPANFSVSY